MGKKSSRKRGLKRLEKQFPFLMAEFYKALDEAIKKGVPTPKGIPTDPRYCEFGIK